MPNDLKTPFDRFLARPASLLVATLAIAQLDTEPTDLFRRGRSASTPEITASPRPAAMRATGTTIVTADAE